MRMTSLNKASLLCSDLLLSHSRNVGRVDVAIAGVAGASRIAALQPLLGAAITSSKTVWVFDWDWAEFVHMLCTHSQLAAELFSRVTELVQKLCSKQGGQQERQEGVRKAQQDQQGEIGGNGKADVGRMVLHCEDLSGVKGYVVKEELQWLLWAGLHSLHSVCTALQALTAPLILNAIAGLSVAAELCHLERHALGPLGMAAAAEVGVRAAGAGVGVGATAAGVGVGAAGAGVGLGAGAGVGIGAAAAAGVGIRAAAAGVGVGATAAPGMGSRECEETLIDRGLLATEVDKALGDVGSMAAITLQVIGLAAASLKASFVEHGNNQRLSEASAKHAHIMGGSVGSGLANDMSWIKPMAYGSLLEFVDGHLPREAGLREGLQCVGRRLIDAAKAVLQCEGLLGVEGSTLGAVCCKIVDCWDAEGGSRPTSYDLFDQLPMLSEECLSSMPVGFCCNNVRCRNLNGVSEVGLVVKGGAGGGRVLPEV